METSAVEQRVQFVWDFTSGQWTMTELCERYGITRPTGYKWIGRDRDAGETGLAERNRAPHGCPHRTPASMEALILSVRKQYGWGAKKLLQVLARRYPTRAWPARSTVNDILARHGQLRKHRRRTKWAHPGAVPLHTERPNQVWPVGILETYHRSGSAAQREAPALIVLPLERVHVSEARALPTLQ